jgi:hypothetical protein
MGPANTMPLKINQTWSANGCPDDTTPQAKAHMGGNQVTGLSSCKTADGWGKDMPYF